MTRTAYGTVSSWLDWPAPALLRAPKLWAQTLSAPGLAEADLHRPDLRAPGLLTRLLGLRRRTWQTGTWTGARKSGALNDEEDASSGSPGDAAHGLPSVLLFMPDLDVGGLQVAFVRLAEALVTQGFRVGIATQHPGGALRAGVLPAIDTPVLLRRRTPASVRPLARLLEHWRADVLISALPHNNLAAIAARMLTRRPVRLIVTEHAPVVELVSMHGGWSYRVLPPLLRLLYPLADATVAVSGGVAAGLQRIAPRQRRLRVIYNPTARAEPTEPADADLGAWCRDAAGSLVLGIGRLAPEKRFQDLIAAVARLRRDRPVRLLIVGEGPERDRLTRCIADHGLTDSVRLGGWVLDPGSYIALANVVAVTSSFEGFGNVIAEALSHGTPVVATDCPVGPSELLMGGAIGRLAPVGDIAAIAQALEATLRAPPDPAALRAHAERFSSVAVGCAYARLIADIAPRAAGPTSPTSAVAFAAAAGISSAPHATRQDDAAPAAAARAGSDWQPRSVAFYIPSLAGGGVERMRLLLIAEFMRRGIKTTLLLSRQTGDLLGGVPPGCEVVAFNSSRTAGDVLKLARILRRQRPDILLASLNHNNIAAMLARLLARGTPLIISQHNALSMESGRQATFGYRIVPFLYWLLSPLAGGIVAVSGGVADDLAATARLRRERITVIYNPVLDRGFDRRAGEASPHPWLVEPGPPVFVTAGRLVWQKDHATLLQAMRLRLNHGPARLLILGDGPERAALQAQAEALGIAEHVDFCGFIQNPLPYLRYAAAFVLSSRHEGFGNVVVEALGCGAPVISTDCPYGPSEILADGAYGCLVPVGDAPAMAAAMAQDLRARWPEAMLRERAQSFRTAHVADQYLALIRRVVDARDSPA